MSVGAKAKTPQETEETLPARAGVFHRWGPILALGLFIASLAVLHEEFRQTPFRKIVAQLDAMPDASLWAALCLCVVSYLLIACYDVLAMRYTKANPGLGRTAFASAASYGVSNAMGLGFLSANAVRLHLYSRWGVDAAVVGVIAIVTAAGLYGGAMWATGAALLVSHGAHKLLLSGPAALMTGALLISAVIGGLVYVWRSPKEVRLFGAILRRPDPATPVLQLIVAGADWAATAGLFWVLLPADIRPGYISFLPLFVFSGLVGGATGLPGGIGAFDAAILLLMPNGSEPAVAAALIGYRAIYYLLPMAMTAVSLAWIGRKSLAQTGRSVTDRMSGLSMVIGPQLISAVIFISGALVLLSAAMPGVAQHLGALGELAPHRLVDVSHFISSLVGALMLFAAFGLSQRVTVAWMTATTLTAAAAVLSPLAGNGWTATIFLAAMTGLLLVSRRAFYRAGGFADLRLDTGTIALLGGALAAFVWAGLVSYRHVDLRADLFWSFALRGDAPRFVRALAGVSSLVVGFLVWRAFHPEAMPEEPESPDAEKLQAAIAGADAGHADANLAWLGDKHLFFSASGASFLQYGVRGRRFVVMGEPCGKSEEIGELLWAFREYSDKQGANLVFYSVGAGLLPRLVDLGLAVQKIGESALIPLKDFSLEGPSRAPLRQARNRAGRDGASFRVVSKDEVPPLLDRLEALSDEWLAEHDGAEKSFSLGRFDRDYLSRFPVAVVERDGAPVAFANIWTTADKRELSVDLMRYGGDAPRAVMDYLFTELALWGKAEGYGLLDLGMAPLSGLDGRRLAPMMTQLGDFLYEHANAIYGFKGLRAFKDKFDPHWEPLYIAAQSRFLLGVGMSDVALLTSGGIVGMLRRGVS